MCLEWVRLPVCVCAWISLTLCYPWTGQMLSCVVTLARTSMVAWKAVFIPRGGEPERKRSWLGEAQLRATAFARSTGTPPPPLFIQRRVETREARQAAGGFRFRRIQAWEPRGERADAVAEGDSLLWTLECGATGVECWESSITKANFGTVVLSCSYSTVQNLENILLCLPSPAAVGKKFMRRRRSEAVVRHHAVV
jgi:hypothetical protein